MVIGDYPNIANTQPMALVIVRRPAKRAFDVLFAGLIAVPSLIVCAAAAAAIKIEDGGPVLFRQERVGQNGKTYSMLKLRTMSVDAESHYERLKNTSDRQGPFFKLAHDPRVTKVGRVLRATSIDELPQFFNVICGHMSVVGPRPALPSRLHEFSDAHLARHNVKPGITGLWQIMARDEIDFGHVEFWDLAYVERCSLRSDLAILLRTFGVVLSRAKKALQHGEVAIAPQTVEVTPVLANLVDLTEDLPEVDAESSVA